MSLEAKQLNDSRSAYTFFVITGKIERAELELNWLRHYAARIIAGMGF